MDLNFSSFQEPRGVMRIIHFVFSICAFATITGYSGQILYECVQNVDEFTYPFTFIFNQSFKLNNNTTCSLVMSGEFSSDAKFFVTTGVLAMLYALGIIVVYAKYDNAYKTNTKLPLYDFLITVVFGVLWLSSSAAWANGLTGLKTATSIAVFNPADCKCGISTSSFSTLNISVIFGFLNFFLWAADLWFLYKETAWFQGVQPHSTSGI